MDLREIPLHQIKIPKDRAREDKGDIIGLAADIKTRGLLQPITVKPDFTLVAGERRYLAHRLNDATKIWAVIRKGETDTSSYEIELVENIVRKDLAWPERAKLELKIWNLKVGEYGEFNTLTNPKGWSNVKQGKLVGSDESAVRRRLELAETMAEVPDLGLDDCKTEDEAWKVNSKLKERGVNLEMLKKVPAHVKEAIDRASEHYIIGDFFEQWETIDTEIADFAEVDPPYGVDLDKRKSRNADDRPMEEYQEWETDTYPALMKRTATAVHSLLKPNAFAVFWYGMSWHSEVVEILRSSGFSIPDIPAVWTKGEGGQTASPDTTLGSCYEPFFLARKGQPKLAKPGRGNVFNFPGLMKKVHPTEKPMPLLEDILKTILFPGSFVLVPFLGSGVTLRAAYKLGHTGMGWDLSQEHKNGFLKRIVEDKGNGKK
jgi:site-specific DNA-methyltransferase (adenine-specific)